MKNRILVVSLAVVLALSVGLIGCGSEELPEITECNITISSTEGGLVTSPGEGTFAYDEREVVSQTAEAQEGYSFVNWTGDVGTVANVNDATTTITVDGNYSVTANFAVIPPTEYDLTISGTVGGEVIIPGEGTFTYDEGTMVDLVAEAEEGYHFVNWTGDVNTISSVEATSTTIIMDNNHSITANFARTPLGQFGLTTSSTAGGYVTIPGEGTFAYDDGTMVSLGASPTSGYSFVNWTGNVGTIANVNAGSTNITMNGDYSITANFVAVYDLTVSSTTEGSVITPGEGTFVYAAGTMVNLVATPNTCYRFVSWTGDVGTVANVNAASTTVTMNSDYSIIASFEKEEAVTFPDPNLEAAIREAIGKPTGPICPSDLEGLTSLNANFESIDDLTGLEHCTSLTKLHLNGNQISNFSPLANLINLTELGLYNTQISNLSHLANLTNLIVLYLGENQISDISPLANLASLRTLHLEHNQISNISPLANLTNLITLELYHNQISDISPLVNLTSLIDLHMGNNQIVDIEPLVNNPGLSEGDTVDLRNNPLSDTSINSYIPQLEARGVAVWH